MTKGHFLAQDEEGNRHRILFGADEDRATVAGAPQRRFLLEDGSAVERLDNQTFRVVGTGAYVTIVPG